MTEKMIPFFEGAVATEVGFLYVNMRYVCLCIMCVIVLCVLCVLCLMVL